MNNDVVSGLIESVADYATVEGRDARGPVGSCRNGEVATADTQTIEAILGSFEPISLQATNESARMLHRTDNKYVMSNAELRKVLTEFRDQFAVLEIDRRRIFDYRSCYFDDDSRLFHEHHQGKRLRAKVRTRQYVDTGDIFFEVKLKGRRGATTKKRQPCDVFGPPTIDDKNLSMLRGFYREAYDKEFTLSLKPALIVANKRFTLVSKAGGERATVDSLLRFEPVGGPAVQIGNDFIIVETKSGDGKGVADRIIQSEHIRIEGSCSKYCIGASLTGQVTKYNNFLPIVRLVREKIVEAESRGRSNR